MITEKLSYCTNDIINIVYYVKIPIAKLFFYKVTK